MHNCGYKVFDIVDLKSNMFSRRSIKMKLYSLTKRQFVLVFVVFFTCIAACAIIGLAGKF